MELPLVGLGVPPTQISPEEYYRIPPRVIYRTYPFYDPAKEPAGYYKWLLEQEPIIDFDPDKIETQEDWVKAGARVFLSAAAPTYATLRDSAVFRRLRLPTAKNGEMPFFRYVIEKKGEVQIRAVTCAACHARILPNGSILYGAQGNVLDITASGTTDRVIRLLTADGATSPDLVQTELRRAFDSFSVPWLRPDPAATLLTLSLDDYAAARSSIVPGVVARSGTSLMYPPRTPDLIGLKDHRFFDNTGLVQHRSIADLMRYSALVDGIASFAGYAAARPPRSPIGSARTRLTDEQLYALALYLYSLEPPANPNRPSKLSEQGRKIFTREGCAACHTPPLYTNNKLTPVVGFTPSAEDKAKYPVMPVYVGTDPRLALQSRKATGYYKVPSLRGVWYRGPFEHQGSVATLEDWFDPNRLREDYVPTGYIGVGVKTRAVKGHEFGLRLSAPDKQALIAFLKTL